MLNYPAFPLCNHLPVADHDITQGAAAARLLDSLACQGSTVNKILYTGDKLKHFAGHHLGRRRLYASYEDRLGEVKAGARWSAELCRSLNTGYQGRSSCSTPSLARFFQLPFPSYLQFPPLSSVDFLPPSLFPHAFLHLDGSNASTGSLHRFYERADDSVRTLNLETIDRLQSPKFRIVDWDVWGYIDNEFFHRIRTGQ